MNESDAVMEASTKPDQSFERYAEFYQAAYKPFIRRIHSLGPVALVDIHQPAGDFSDKGTTDVVLLRPRSSAFVHVDFGAGQFSARTRSGDFSVSPPGFDNTVIVDSEHRLEAMTIPWDEIKRLRAAEDQPISADFGPALARTNPDPEMDHVFNGLWRLDPDTESLSLDTSILWVSHRLDAWRDSGTRQPQSRSEHLSRRALNRCIEGIHETKDGPLTLDQLAAEAQLSPFHFCRAFKAATGLPPHRYQLVRRIARARDLLAHTKLPVAEIAEAVGYSDVAYFTRLFRRETGFPPARWRRERHK